MVNLILAVLIVLTRQAEPPLVTVTAPHTRITSSCRLTFPTGQVLADPDGDGVVIIDADGITVEFTPGTELRGAAQGTPGDELKGSAVRIAGHKNVTLRNAKISGYKVGIRAEHADGLVIDHAAFDDLFRNHLKSTYKYEESSDWLWPHSNDADEWAVNYGGAIRISDSSKISVHDVTVRHSQNGILLSRVDHAEVFDNDCSFLSGWGLAMWRSCDNLVSRNAFDFCIRGHSEGHYNRGEDSAGILVFEQCSRNRFIENSATHCGDGFFGFAGSEAIGEKPPSSGAIVYGRLGCNDNLLQGNDFSFAAAHGIEMTFSFGNRFVGNRIVENAISGIWGGFCQETLIANNEISRNGGMAGRYESGGICIEHGAHNHIVGNTFVNNRSAVHLWRLSNKKLLDLPGIKAAYKGAVDNIIEKNKIVITQENPFVTSQIKAPRLVGLMLRDGQSGLLKGTVYSGNAATISAPNCDEFEMREGLEINRQGAGPAFTVDPPAPIGVKRPVGAQSALAGRAAIVMGPWGPWDHHETTLRLLEHQGVSDRFELLGVADDPTATSADQVTATIAGEGPGGGRVVTVVGGDGLTPYSLVIKSGRFTETVRGTLAKADWSATFFPWTIDPLKDHDGWLEQSRSPRAVTLHTHALDFPFGSKGPKGLELGPAIAASGLNTYNFGVLASTTINMPEGHWKLLASSDDGIRVRVDGKLLIDNWTIHVSSRDTAAFVQPKTGPVKIEIEYFQASGSADLALEIQSDR